MFRSVKEACWCVSGACVGLGVGVTLGRALQTAVVLKKYAKVRTARSQPLPAPPGCQLKTLELASQPQRDPGRASPSAVLQKVNCKGCVPVAQVTTPHQVAEAFGLLDRDSRVRSTPHSRAGC